MKNWKGLMVLLFAAPALLIGCTQPPEVVDDVATNVEEAVDTAADKAEDVAEEIMEAVEMLDKDDGAEVIVGDVLDYSLEPSDDWADTGSFGWVEFKLHEGRYDGEPIHYIRTDASDKDFAEANGLVHVPLLAAATAVDGATASLYVFDDGADGQMPVMSSSPAEDGFSSAWHVRTVSFDGDATLLESAADIEAAVEAGDASLDEGNLVVNYPVVKWPGGQLPVDDALDSYFGTGQLIALDEEGGSVTFKLHECYSGARYIVTDSSAGAMATDMMNIAASTGTGNLVDAGATDNIWVFGNGLEGSGVMGFQPAVFRNKAGEPGWSPFWNHFTLTWADGVEPRVLSTGAEVAAAIEAGDVKEWAGTPNTDPQGFVVNCPVPILAENTYEPAEAAAPAMLDKDDGAEVIVGDVLDYSLEPSDEWADTGSFGWVEFKLHEGRYDGEPIHYIRTDASDKAFAEANGLVHVPLLAAATAVDGATSSLYVFENGTDGQMPVMSSSPAEDGFSSAWHVRSVAFDGDATLLESAADIEAAAEAGDVTIGEGNLVVNYPVVSWPGGMLPVDDALDSYLGTGQILSLDYDAEMVRFKLHECYSGARYIVTDSSAGAMATDMMNIAASTGTGNLVDAGAVDNIWVFGNGIEGSGVMGFQPAVFRNKAGEPGWSPFWNHFTLTWEDGVEPRVLSTGAEVAAAIEAGDVKEWAGTPNTDPQGFVVNCPVPVLAPNTFDGS